MDYLLTSAEMSDADQYTSAVIGIPSEVLMERAALGVAEEIRHDFPEPGLHADVAVIAGKGNNGADAVAAGRILTEDGYAVHVFLVESIPSSLQSGSSLGLQLHILEQYGIHADILNPGNFSDNPPDIIIDGLFGTGLSRVVKEPYLSAIEAINRASGSGRSRVYSVDIASGVDGTTGEVRGIAVHADVTITFAFYKRGHFLYPGCSYCGKIVRKNIGITERSLRSTPEMFTCRAGESARLLPERNAGGNKGTFGKVLVIAGSRGVSGACTMCAQAVLRIGAGMVRIFTHEDNRIILQETVPEAMCSTYSGEDDFSSGEAVNALYRDMEWADVIAIGPGLGRSTQAGDILSRVLEYASEKTVNPGNHEHPLKGIVIDADAVRLIRERDLYRQLKEAGDKTFVILTPHMAECAELLKMGVQELLGDRIRAIKQFANLYSCTIIGKDARSLAASAGVEQVYLNTTGNDGLATAGSGDVLTGITAGCLAQGMSGFEAVCAAAYIHGLSADYLADIIGKRPIMATDIIHVLTGLRREE